MSVSPHLTTNCSPTLPPPSTVGARKLVDNYEERLTVATTRLDRAKDKYERLAKILINVKAGIDHLTDKLASVREDSAPVAMSDDTIVDVMYQCETTLVGLLNRIKTVESAQTKQSVSVLWAPAAVSSATTARIWLTPPLFALSASSTAGG